MTTAIIADTVMHVFKRLFILYPLLLNHDSTISTLFSIVNNYFLGTFPNTVLLHSSIVLHNHITLSIDK
jgi:hypothetical protein